MKVMQPIRDLGDPVADLVGEMPYVEMQCLLDALWPKGTQAYMKAGYFRELDDHAIETMARFHQNATSPSSEIHIQHFGGAIARVGEDETAHRERQAPFVLNAIASTHEPTGLETHMDWAQRLYAEIEPSLTGGAYINFLSAEGEDRVKAAYGTREVRPTADAKGPLRPDQPVPPKPKHPAIMTMAMRVEEMTFRSEGVECAARVYRPDVAPGEATPCVVMANGFSLTRDDGLPAFAERFAGVGITALTFDFRHLGGSGGEPRQVIDTNRQQADFGAAVSFARGLEGIDADAVAVWGFSSGGGLAIYTAADDHRIAAAVALCPATDTIAFLRRMPMRTLNAVNVAILRNMLGRARVHIPVAGAQAP